MALWIYDSTNCDPACNYSLFHMLDSLMNYLKRKKVDVRLFTDESELDNIFEDTNAVIYLIEKPNTRFINFISRCNQRRIPVFAHTPKTLLPGCYFSSFWSDTALVFTNILSYLMQNGKRSIAYFGACNSETDNYNLSTLFSLYPAFDYTDIFYMTPDSIDDCFNEFFKARKKYDAVICTNDMVGVYLIERLKNNDPEYFDKTFIISFMNSILSHVCHIPLTSCSHSNDIVPSVIHNMYRFLSKTKDLFAQQTISLESKIYNRETTQNIPFDPSVRYIPLSEKFIRTYTPPRHAILDTNDVVLKRLIKFEVLLREKNKSDLIFLLLLLKGALTDEICEILYISSQTVAYRSNAIFNFLGVKSKKEFRDFYQKYVSCINFEKYINNF